MWSLTRHAKKRMRQRSVSDSRVRRTAHGKKAYEGRSVYRVEREENGLVTVIVYKQVGTRRIVLSTWKKRSQRPSTT